jgi:hypothetical protein
MLAGATRGTARRSPRAQSALPAFGAQPLGHCQRETTLSQPVKIPS